MLGDCQWISSRKKNNKQINNLYKNQIEQNHDIKKKHHLFAGHDTDDDKYTKRTGNNDNARPLITKGQKIPKQNIKKKRTDIKIKYIQ